LREETQLRQEKGIPMKFQHALYALVLLAGTAQIAAAQTPGTWNHGSADQVGARSHLEKFKAMSAPELEKVRNDGRAVYQICSGCHLPEGWGTTDGTFPQIAGQIDVVTIKQLSDIRAKIRRNPVMDRFIEVEEIAYELPDIGGGPYALAVVAKYIEGLLMHPEPGVGAGDNLTLGEKLYKENCRRCHGENGEGRAASRTPLIQGQHYEYLLRQFAEMRSGARSNGDPEMLRQVQGFSDTDAQAVLDYVSRLKPPAERLAPNVDWWNPDF
jgi:cytochrome c553